MVLMPLIERELRVAARRGKNYWLRVAAALAAAVICLWVVLWSGRAQPPAMLGKTLFTYLSVLAFAFCLLVGPFITADCVSEEKRDGTLGLLFLTELRSFHVVLGKWIATSLAGFYGLLAILPSLGLPLLLGGVTPGEYGRVALAVTNAILFSLTAGLFVSTISREQTKATLGSVALILGLTGLVPGLFVFFMTGVLGRPVNQLPPLALVSPAYTGYLATDTMYRAGPQLYWTSLALVHGLSWLFLILTAVLLPRVWRQDPGEKPVTRRWLVRLGYTPGWRWTFRRRLERNPIYAVGARLRWPHLVFWTLVTLVAINVYWIAIGSRKNPGAHQFHQNFAYALIFTNRVWITVMAAHFFLEARRTGALELLLTSPLPVRTLLRGHWRALRRYFVWPIVVIGLLHVAFVWGSWSQLGARTTMGFNYLPYYIASATSSYVNFLTDVLALCFVGAWLSVSLSKPTPALLLTFASVILVPWALGYYLASWTGIFPVQVTNWFQSLPWIRQLFPAGALGFPLGRTLAWVTKNLLFIWWARRRLHRHLRAAAAQTPDWGWARWWPRPSGWARGRSVAPLAVAGGEARGSTVT
jgi:ABC-type transport system involved in multi-copper enzyme maturation permease subunit